MHSGPVPSDGGWDEDPARRAAEPAAWEPVITRPDPMTEQEWLASLDATARADEPPEDEEEPSGEYGWTEIEASPAAQFATGQPFDVMPGRADLAQFADEAAGADDSFTGACDDELLGVLRAWDRVEAHAAARKFAAVAELMRRRPAPGTAVEGPARIPAECAEFTVCELVTALALSRWYAYHPLSFAYDLAVRLPGTRAAFTDGVVNQDKAEIIAGATAVLTPEEARAAEALVLGRAGRLTPSGLRSAIARAVIQVAPDKARKRREKAAREARVERWAEVSGNTGLAGRELPPAQALAADQKITAWARQLKKAGLEGGMDQLRARAYLDMLLGTDSRPRQDSGPDNPGQASTGQDNPRQDNPGQDNPGRDGTGQGGGGGAGQDGTGQDSTGRDGAGRDGRDGGGGAGRAPDGSAPGGPAAGAIPAGFAGKVNLIVPLATLLDLADRAGEIPGIGPIDPWLARDLARAAAQNPRTTFCVTVTDQDGHAIGHGCARPEPKNQQRQREKHRQPGPGDGPGPPSGIGARAGPGFAFTATGQHGPPGGYGTWRLRTGASGHRDLLVALDPIATGDCDHRFEAKGHDPGVKLRHLSQIRHAVMRECHAAALFRRRFGLVPSGHRRPGRRRSIPRRSPRGRR
jgi:Domain of unknown function (DUF222)